MFCGDAVSMKWPFFYYWDGEGIKGGRVWSGFLSPFFSKYGSILLTFWQEVVSYKKKTVFEHSLKILCLRRKGTYPKFTVLVHFWAQCWWKNFCCGSTKTCVILVLVLSFFIFLSLLWHWVHFLHNLLKKIKIIKIIIVSEAFQTLKVVGVFWPKYYLSYKSYSLQILYDSSVWWNITPL